MPPVTGAEYKSGVRDITSAISQLSDVTKTLIKTVQDSSSTRPSSGSSGSRYEKNSSRNSITGISYGNEFYAMQQGLETLIQEFTRLGESFKEFRTLRIENRKSFAEFNKSSSAVIKAVKAQGMMSVLSMREVTSTLMDIERNFIDKYQDISEDEQANIATYINKAAVSLNVEGKRIYSAIELNAKVAKNSSKFMKETLGIASRTDTYFRGKFSEQLWDSLSEREVDFAIMARGNKAEMQKAAKEYAAASQVAAKYGVKDLLDKILSTSSGPLDALTENAAALGKYSNILMRQYENSDIIGMTETLVKAESEFYNSLKGGTSSALAMQMQLKALGGEFKPTKDFLADAFMGAAREGMGFSKDIEVARKNILLGADASLDDVEHTAGAFIDNIEYISKRFFSLSTTLNNLIITASNLGNIAVNMTKTGSAWIANLKQWGIISDTPGEIASFVQPLNRGFNEAIGVDVSKETILNFALAFARNSTISDFYKSVGGAITSIDKKTGDLFDLVFGVGTPSSTFFKNLTKIIKGFFSPLLVIGNVILSSFLAFSRQILKLMLPKSEGIGYFLRGFLGSDSKTLVGAIQDGFKNVKINIAGNDFPLITPEEIKQRQQERKDNLDKAEKEQRDRMKDSDYRFKFQAFKDTVLTRGTASNTAFLSELNTWKRGASAPIAYDSSNNFDEWVDRMILYSTDLQEAINNLDIGERTDIDILSDTMKEVVPQKIASSIGDVLGKPIVDIYNLLHAYFSRNKTGRAAISSFGSSSSVGTPTAGTPIAGKGTYFIDRRTGAVINEDTYFARKASKLDISNGIETDNGINTIIERFWNSPAITTLKSPTGADPIRPVVEQVWRDSITERNKDKWYNTLSTKGLTPISRNLADVQKAFIKYQNDHIHDSEALRQIAQSCLNIKDGTVDQNKMLERLRDGFENSSGSLQGGVEVDRTTIADGFASSVTNDTLGDNSDIEAQRNQKTFKGFLKNAGGKLLSAGIAVSGMLGGAEGILGALGVGRESATGRLATIIQYATMGASGGPRGIIAGAVVGLIMSSPTGKRLMETVGKVVDKLISPFMKVLDALLAALEPLVNLLIPLADLITPPIEAFCDIITAMTNLISGGIKGFITFIAKLIKGKGNVGFTDWVNNGKETNLKEHGVSRKYWADTNAWVKSSEDWGKNIEETGWFAEHASGGLLTSADGMPINNGKDNLLVSAQTGETILSRRDTQSLLSDSGNTNWMDKANENQPFVKNYQDYYAVASSNLGNIDDSTKKSLDIQAVCLAAIQVNTLAILDRLNKKLDLSEIPSLLDAIKAVNANAISASASAGYISNESLNKEQKERSTVLDGRILNISHESGGILNNTSGMYFPNGNGNGNDNLYISAQTGEAVLSREDTKALFTPHDKGTLSLSSIPGNTPLGKQLAFIDWAKKNLPTKKSMEDLDVNNIATEFADGSYVSSDSLGLGQGSVSIKEFIKSQNGSLDDKTVSHYADLIAYASKELGLDQRVIAAQIAKESHFNKNSYNSGSTASGMFQITNDTWGNRKGDRFNPDEAVIGYVDVMRGKAKAIKKLLSTTDFSKMTWDDISKVLAAYNAGQGNVIKHKGVPNFRETKDYVSKIKGWAESIKPVDDNTKALKENTKALKNQFNQKKDFKPAEYLTFLKKVGLSGMGFENLSDFRGREFKVNSKTGNVYEITKDKGAVKRFESVKELKERLTNKLLQLKSFNDTVTQLGFNKSAEEIVKGTLNSNAAGTFQNGKLRGLTKADGIPFKNGADDLLISAQTGEGIIPRHMMPKHAEGTVEATGYSGDIALKRIINDNLVVPIFRPMLNSSLSNEKQQQLLSNTVNQLFSAYQKATGSFLRSIQEYLPNIDNSIDRMFGTSWLGQIGAAFTKGLSNSLGINDIFSSAGGILESLAKGDFNKIGELVNQIGQLFGGMGKGLTNFFDGISNMFKGDKKHVVDNKDDVKKPDIDNNNNKNDNNDNDKIISTKNTKESKIETLVSTQDLSKALNTISTGAAGLPNALTNLETAARNTKDELTKFTASISEGNNILNIKPTTDSKQP